MDTENEYVKNFSAARERLIAERRALAGELVKPYERIETSESREKFIAIQKVIESIDRALADETRIANPKRRPMAREIVRDPR